MSVLVTERYLRPAARSWRTTPPPAVLAFHAALPGYAPTRLVEVPDLAAELGVGRVFVKEESERFGLPAFKILGASYAIAQALAERAGLDAIPSLETRPEREPVTMIAATDGNHGRAVARVARWLGLPTRIFLPGAISAAAKDGIRAEGAEVIELDLPYDHVVRVAAAARGEDRLLIQDTAWRGYTTVPQWIVDGYDTLFAEADDQLRQAGAAAPSLVVVPVGVGSLAQATVRHHRSAREAGPSLLAVEPAGSAPVLRSLQTGRPVTVATEPTIMAGLSCGTPSSLAWPYLRDGLDAAVTVTDAEAVRAADDLAAYDVDAGPCGAAALAGVRNAALDLSPDAVVVLLSTEGRAANPVPGGKR